MEEYSLDVPGYRDQRVPNTFLAQPEPTSHLGIVLPGFRHTADRADLHFAGRILLDRRADLLRVDYVYSQTNFMDQPEVEQDAWLACDVLAVCNAALSFRPYQSITLIGKSLGTKAMGHLLADQRFQGANCIWLTPLLTDEWLCSQIKHMRPRSLFIIGTADKFYQPDTLKQLKNVTSGHSVVIEGANHELEVPDSIPKTLTALKRMVQAMQEFIGVSLDSA